MRLLYVEDERLIRESVAKQIQKMFPLYGDHDHAAQ